MTKILFSRILRARICKLLRSPKNRFQEINSASICSLGGPVRQPYSYSVLAPIDCLKIPALDNSFTGIFKINTYVCLSQVPRCLEADGKGVATFRPVLPVIIIRYSTLQPKSQLFIPRKGIARPQSQFPCL
jgi:hypothetical protein